MADKEGGVGPTMASFWTVIVILTLFFMWVNNGGPVRAKKEGFFKNQTSVFVPQVKTSSSGRQSNADNVQADPNVSSYKGIIRLSVGTARAQYQPNAEYVIITNSRSKTPVNIGGWTLKNGRSNKTYAVTGNTVQGQSVAVKIPTTGSYVYHPFDVSQGKRGAITLKSGERAYIITGSLPTVAGIAVRDNFKTNRCLGYLEDKPGYRFIPRLSYRCPSPREVVGISSLDDACYKFVRSLRACHKPEDVRVKDGGFCLDGNCSINSACRNFVTSNFNFQSCFNTYSRDEDFSAPEWRVYLNRTWELWEDNRETISLYDRAGLLVDEITY